MEMILLLSKNNELSKYLLSPRIRSKNIQEITFHGYCMKACRIGEIPYTKLKYGRAQHSRIKLIATNQ